MIVAVVWFFVRASGVVLAAYTNDILLAGMLRTE